MVSWFAKRERGIEMGIELVIKMKTVERVETCKEI